MEADDLENFVNQSLSIIRNINPSMYHLVSCLSGQNSLDAADEILLHWFLAVILLSYMINSLTMVSRDLVIN